MFSITTITLLSAAAGIVSAIAPNTQSCTASDRGALLAAYGVDIGIGYNGGSGCNDVYNRLVQACSASNWQCVDDNAGGTQLYFNCETNHGSDINQALGELYPTVNSFNCPDY